MSRKGEEREMYVEKKSSKGDEREEGKSKGKE